MAATHCIENFQLDLGFSSEALARSEQNQLAQWLSDDLLPALDVLFNHYSPGQQCLRFERLEFDLGQLNGSNYRQQIKQQLLEKFAALLGERQLALPGSNLGLLSGPELGNQTRRLEQLVLFLRTGQMPWYSDHTSGESANAQAEAKFFGDVASAKASKHHQGLLAGLLNHAGLADALRAIPEREQLLQRMVSQFPDEQLASLLKYTAADFYRQLVPAWQLVSKLRDTQGLGRVQLKQVWWKNILRLWLDRGHLSQAVTGFSQSGAELSQSGSEQINTNANRWPAQLLQSLAHDLSLPPALLYKQLLRLARTTFVDSSSAFVRYVGGGQLQGSTAKNTAASKSAVDSMSLSGHEPAAASAVKQNPGARELRYQLAQIFNNGDGAALALLWPELLAHHKPLVDAALKHYLAIPSIRQKLVLRSPLMLLGDIFAFLQPDWQLGSAYAVFAQKLASAIAVDTNPARIERDLWEISFNQYIHAPATSYDAFAADVLYELVFRSGVDPIVFADAIADSFGEKGGSPVQQSFAKRIAELFPAATIAVTSDQDNFAQSPSNLQGHKSSEHLAPLSSRVAATHPVIAALQQSLHRLLSHTEQKILQDLLRLLLVNVDAKDAATANLASVLSDAASLPDNLLAKFFAQIAQQKPDALASRLTEVDWQLLASYGFSQPGATNIASADKQIPGAQDAMSHKREAVQQVSSPPIVFEPSPTNVQHNEENFIAADASAISLSSLEQITPENPFAASPSAQAAVDISQNRDLRWQEFLRQLQRGNIALDDLHLNDNSGIQIVEHYLNQAGHIQPEYRQNLLGSISAMSRRAPDTADYFRRVIHCLIYQQPLDFDEIVTSKDFWRKPEQDSSSKTRDAAVTELDSKNTLPPANRFTQLADHEKTTTAMATAPAQAYEQQLWALLQHIKKSTQSRFQFNLAQLQQLVEFYLIHSPELANEFRSELAVAIADHANKIPSQSQRFNYYANLLQRLLASADIDVTDPVLLAQTEWVQLSASTAAEGDPGSAASETFLENAAGLVSNSTVANATISEGAAFDAIQDKSPLVDDDTTAAEISDAIGAVTSTPQSPSGNFGWLATDQLTQLQRQLTTGALQLDDLLLSEAQWQALAELFIVHSDQLANQEKIPLLVKLKESAFASTNPIGVFGQWLRQHLQSISAISSTGYLTEITGTASTVPVNPAAQPINATAVLTVADEKILSQPRQEHGLSPADIPAVMESAGSIASDKAEGLSQRAEPDEHQMAQADAVIPSNNEVAPVVADINGSSGALASDNGHPGSFAALLAAVENATRYALDKHQLAELLRLGDMIVEGSFQLDQLKANSQQLEALVNFFMANHPAVVATYGPDLAGTVQYYADSAKDRRQYFSAVLKTVLQGLPLDVAGLAAQAPQRQTDAVDGAATKLVAERLTAEKVAANETERSVPVAELLQVVAISDRQAPEKYQLAELLRLGELIAKGRIQVNQLQASAQQLAALVKFFSVNRPGIPEPHRLALITAIQTYADLAQDKRKYFSDVLQTMLQGADMDLENISMRARQTPIALADLQVRLGAQKDNAESLASLAENKIVSAPEMHLNTIANQAESALLRASKTVGDSEQSLLELMLVPSLTQAQSLRLQHLLQALLKRGKPDAIRLWFNSSLEDAQLIRLTDLLPDYALHQLLRLAQPEAYGAIYPQAKQVLDVVAMAIPGVSVARLHQTKWLFLLRQSLRKGVVDHNSLLVFAQQLAKAAGSSDTAMLEKLVRERLVINASEEKSVQKEPRANAETLLQDALQEGIHISNAGQVLAAPYIGRLFAMLQLTEQGEFVSLAAKDRAVHLLEYMVTGSSAAPEYDLLLNKVLCGMSTGIPVSAGIEVTEQEETIIGQLLNSIIQNWKAIGSTSITGLRETFLRRQGWLRLDEDGWHLQVQAGPFDMLLDKLPWSISLIKHGWMEKPLRVSWRE